jgi:hypothetical protein
MTSPFFNLRGNANVELGSETETLKLTFGTSNLFSPSLSMDAPSTAVGLDGAGFRDRM